MPRMIWLIAIVVLLIAAGGLIWWRFFDTYHLATVDPGKLYRDGNRSPRVFSTALSSKKVKTVVCLVDDREMVEPMFVAEQEYCKGHGIELVRIPIRLGGWPSGDQVDRFLTVATDPAKQPVLVHCAQGVRRTGMMAAAYQESVLKYDKDKAKAAILTFEHSERSIGDVRKFIDVYDPATRAMTRELEMSKE